MTKSVSSGICKAILHEELEPIRFERFCSELLTDIEGGRIILPTSQSWDRGRDGRSAGPGERILLCVTLDHDLPPKALADIRKVAGSKYRVDKLYYCTSRTRLEQQLDDANRKIGELEGKLARQTDRQTDRHKHRRAAELPFASDGLLAACAAVLHTCGADGHS